MSKKQPSARKLAAARANAAKSCGPKTPEGKARSSQNARRHGICANIILSTEDNAEFDRMYQSYVDRFRPVDEVEHDLVDTMVWAKWRERRIIALETEAAEIELVKMEEYVSDWDELSDLGHTQKAYRAAQRDTPWHRYEAHAARQYERALKQLLLLRKSQPAIHEEPEVQNEANPISEHATAPQPIPIEAPAGAIPRHERRENSAEPAEDTPPPLDDGLKAA